MPEFVEVATPEDVEAVRTLFAEYKQSVGVDLWFGNAFADEMDDLPHPYVRPGGRLLLVRHEGQIAGCGALRRIDATTGEMKRMWMRPAFRRNGLGRSLAAALVTAAREEGYLAVRLETLSVMPKARALYEKMGFAEIPHTAPKPFQGSTMMELRLS